MHTIRTRLFALAALAAMAAACDSPTNNERDPMHGSLRADISGDRTDSYVAEGIAHRDSLLAKTAAAALEDDEGYLVTAFRLTGAGRGDRVLLITEGKGAGTYSLAGCAAGTAEGCLWYGGIGYNLLPSGGNDPDRQVFVFWDEGTLTIESVSGGRMKGTFSGTGVRGGSSSTISVQDGRFDVPVMPSAAAPARLP